MSHSHATRRSRVKIRPGAAPGALAFDPHADAPQIQVFGYGPDGFEEFTCEDLADVHQTTREWPVTWINVDGARHEATVTALRDTFDLHALALEDVVNVGQRAKCDAYDDHLFIVVRMALPQIAGATEQICLFVGKNWVLSFQERHGDCFDPVRERIRAGKGRARRAGPDYLAYALIDAVIDGYFPVLERAQDKLEALEKRIFTSPDKEIPIHLQSVRTELRELRQANWPHRDVISTLLHPDTKRVTDQTRTYLRDCADHAARVQELIESCREETTDLMNSYLSNVSNRMNEVMKVLTIVASIFIPLSFVAGVYGMNFDPDASRWNMPELGWAYGYPAVLTLMAAIGIGLLLTFKKKGWF